METTNYGHLSRQLKQATERIATLGPKSEYIVSAPHSEEIKAKLKLDGLNQNYVHSSMAGELRGVCMVAMWEVPTLESLIPEINRLERIVSALESIGVNLDEEDIVALERIASGSATDPDRDELRQSIAERRYHFATQKLIDLKWHLANMEFQAPANSLLRTEIHTQIEVAQRAIDALLSDNFPNETDASTDERFVRVVE